MLTCLHQAWSCDLSFTVSSKYQPWPSKSVHLLVTYSITGKEFGIRCSNRSFSVKSLMEKKEFPGGLDSCRNVGKFCDCMTLMDSKQLTGFQPFVCILQLDCGIGSICDGDNCDELMRHVHTDPLLLLPNTPALLHSSLLSFPWCSLYYGILWKWFPLLQSRV